MENGGARRSRLFFFSPQMPQKLSDFKASPPHLNQQKAFYAKSARRLPLFVYRLSYRMANKAAHARFTVNGRRSTDNGGRQYGCRKPRTPKVSSLISHLSRSPLFLDNSAMDVVSCLHYVKIKFESDGSLICG